jgi:hypothetical protein
MLGVAALLKKARPSSGDSTSAEFARVAILSGDQFRSAAQPLERGRLEVVMGGADVDLSGAEAAPGAELHVFVKAGGARVTVPHGWRVESRVRAAFGGVDRGPAPADLGSDAPLLTVSGTVIFGGLQIARS